MAEAGSGIKPPADQPLPAPPLTGTLTETCTAKPREAPGPADSDLEPGIQLLALAYPEFTIGQSVRGRHGPTWTVTRKDSAQPGLYAAVTPDLTELRDILARYTSHPGVTDPGT